MLTGYTLIAFPLKKMVWSPKNAYLCFCLHISHYFMTPLPMYDKKGLVCSQSNINIIYQVIHVFVILHLKKLKSPSVKNVYARFGWNKPMFIFIILVCVSVGYVFSLVCYYARTLHLIWNLFHQGCFLSQVWLMLSLWF